MFLFTNAKTENLNGIEENASILKGNWVFVSTVEMGSEENITIASDPLYAYVIGDDVFTDVHLLTSLIESFEYDICYLTIK